MKKIILIPTFILNVLYVITCYSQNNSGWYSQSSGTNLNLQNMLFINQNTGWIVGGTDGLSCAGIILKTTNAGQNWISQFSGSFRLNNIYFINSNTGYVVGGNVTILGSVNRIILKTTNGGQNWITILYDAQNPCPLSSICFSDTLTGCFGGYSSTGILKTTNGGMNFFNINVSHACYDIQFTDSNTGYYCGEQYIFKTTDSGNNWNLIFYDASQSISGIFFINSFVGYAIGNGTLKTINGGINWVILNVDELPRTCVRFSDIDHGAVTLFSDGDEITNIEEINSWGAIDLTTNGGNNWIRQTLSSSRLTSVFFINKDTGWVCGYNGIIYKTTTGGITGILPKLSYIPEKFSLSQNYPNPFNPTTKIKFDISSEGKSQKAKVKLVIYNILGKEIQTLVNEQLQPGTYEVTFDGSNLPSGVYFYQLSARNYTDTKKLILLK
jgi:photosystem II stability/assembly factor-like uncharacterized protein